MKKTLIAACAALALSFAAHAENWIMVMEAKEGPRLLVDMDSFGAKTWPDASGATNPGILWIAAKFMFYNADGAGTPFLYTTRYESCKTGNGELVYQEWDGTHFANKGRYWWSTDGGKMHDSGGLALCTIAKAVAAPAKQKQQSGTTL